MRTEGWFEGVDPEDLETAADRIRTGRAETPDRWPEIAVESGFAPDADAYYDRLREATIRAARGAVRERERADDQQLIHAIRTHDDLRSSANELAERTAAWAGSLFEAVEADPESIRALADREPAPDEAVAEKRVRSLAARVDELLSEAEAIDAYVETTAPAVAPNLSAMAGPMLTARLISLAGGLEALAKQPSGTIQVLGAEDALFAHLAGRGPSPKHGVIYTHEYVRGTHPDDRGSAARAFAGKLAIAARIDHYSGEYREDVHEELRDRIATIQARTDEGATGPAAETNGTEEDRSGDGGQRSDGSDHT